MKGKKKKPCEQLKVDYIKLTFKDGKVESVTVKVVNKANSKKR